MTVGDIQAHFRALAIIIGAGKGINKDLDAAAKALEPFAKHKMEAFAKFLQLAEEKYGTTGELPDGKPVKAPKEKKPPKVKADKPTAAGLVAKVGELKAALARNEGIDRNAVTAEINKFSGLTKKDLDGAMLGDLKFPAKSKTKDAALADLVNDVLANSSAEARVQV